MADEPAIADEIGDQDAASFRSLSSPSAPGRETSTKTQETTGFQS
jgi:hypothetical protein